MMFLLTNEKFHSASLVSCVQALEDNRTIRKIDLRLCNIGADNEASIAELVKVHGSSMDYNQVGHSGTLIPSR